MARGISPTSSRKRVPPSAAARRPVLSLCAPVKAPALCPKSSASRRVSGRAAQLTVIMGLSARALRPWMARAMRFFPVPVSPLIMTVVALPAMVGSTSKRRRMAGSLETIPPRGWPRSRRRKCSRLASRSTRVAIPPMSCPCRSYTGAVESVTGSCRLPGPWMSVLLLYLGFFKGHRPPQGAIFAHQIGAEDPVINGADGGGTRQAQGPEGGVVDGHDPHVPVDGEHTLGNAVEKGFQQGRRESRLAQAVVVFHGPPYAFWVNPDFPRPSLDHPERQDILNQCQPDQKP